MPEEDVEQLLVSLILDNRIQGHIDQVNRLLERSDRSNSTNNFELQFHLIKYVHFRFSKTEKGQMIMGVSMCRSKGMKKYAAVDKWNTQLRSLCQSISNRVG